MFVDDVIHVLRMRGGTKNRLNQEDSYNVHAGPAYDLDDEAWPPMQSEPETEEEHMVENAGCTCPQVPVGFFEQAWHVYSQPHKTDDPGATATAATPRLYESMACSCNKQSVY